MKLTLKKNSELPSRGTFERSDVSTWKGREGGDPGGGLEAGVRPGCHALVLNGELEKSSPDCTAHIMVRSGLLKHHQLTLEGAVTMVAIM